MPMKINAEMASRLRTQHKEAKLAYIKLNRQMPCPPRGTVPVNQAHCGRIFHLSIPGSLSVMAATIPAMSDDGIHHLTWTATEILKIKA
jgi:hypothetical protein